MIKTFHSLIIAAFTALVALGVTISHQAHAGEVNFTSFSVEPFTDVESDGRRSLHVRLCGNGLSVDGRKIYGSQCARLKTDMKPGSRWQHHIIFESSRFSVFPIKTSNRDGANYKFWLRERSIDDTQSFSSFLKKAPTDGQLVIGAICKKLTDKNFFNQVIARKVENRNAAGSLDRRVMEGVSRERAMNALIKIARRCTSTAERIAGPIQISTGTLASAKAPAPQFTKICGIRATGVILNSDKIKTIQRRLKKRGLYSGRIDGIMGSGSCEGLKRFIQIEIPQKDQLGRYISKSVFTYNMMQRLNANPSRSVLSKYQTERVLLECKQNRADIRSNQTVLKDLGLYTSSIDGVPGPNYRRAVTAGEQLLGTRADDLVGCLTYNERYILSKVQAAQMKGSQCKSLLSVDEVKSTFEDLKDSELTAKTSLAHANIAGLVWMIDTISDLEKRLTFTDFYKVNDNSKRDCRLDGKELEALAPKEPVNINLTATTLFMTASEVNDEMRLRLVARGNDLETSSMSKSVFGGTNEASMDIRFTDFKGKRVLDFVLSEENTKINLHLYDNGMTNRTLEAQMPELFLDEQPDGWSAFYIRMYDDGTTNVKNGDFTKIVSPMPESDKAMIAALCGQVEKVSASNEGFVASFEAAEERDMFRRSEFSREPVREAVSLLAKQCVDEIKTKGLVTASFDVEAQVPVCTSKQNELLSKLDSDIEAGQTSLQGFRDDITALKVERPKFERVQCDAYVDELKAAESTLAQTEQRMAQATDTLSNLNIDIKEGQELLVRLNDLGQSSDLCNLESDELKQRINKFVQSQNPAATGLLCSDDYTKSPLQIVIDEINVTISRLLDEHISSDELAEIRRQIGALEQERIELTKLFAVTSARKASPKELAELTQINEGLQNTVADVEAQVSALEDEILNLRAVMNDNTSLIEEIDTLNQQLVDLTSEKQRVQNVLEELKSEVLQAQAGITQRELQLEKTTLQIQDLEVQLGAASSTSVSLKQEVVELNRNIETKQENVEELNRSVASAQALIDDANSVIAQNSQKVAELDIALNAKNAEAVTLSSSLEKLSPQADAAEQTVLDLEASLAADFVPLDQFKEQEARLNDLTQTVTERTKLIRELRADLEAIEGEEQLMVKMCLADAKCKAAMGDRLGVE